MGYELYNLLWDIEFRIYSICIFRIIPLWNYEDKIIFWGFKYILMYNVYIQWNILCGLRNNMSTMVKSWCSMAKDVSKDHGSKRWMNSQK